MLRIIEFFTGSLRGSSDLASRRMLLLLGEAGVSLVLALTQLFLFVSDFSRITFFLFRLACLDEAFPMMSDPPKSLFVKTTEAPVFLETPSMRSVSRMMSCDMTCVTFS